MKQHITVGVVCLARKTFDFIAAKGIYDKIQVDLKGITNIQWQFIDELVIEVKDAQQAAKQLFIKKIDALICISGTFALGHLVLELNKVLKVPILLWGLEELPYNGGKIRLNSVCGITLNASNLYKAGIKNYHIVIGNDVDEDWIDAIRILTSLSQAHIGVIGSRANGFFNLDIDELALYSKVGVLVDYYQLNDLLNLPIDYHKLSERKSQIESVFDISGINSKQLEKVAELIVRLKSFIEKHQLTAIAIRCWPEFAQTYGISPCAAMSVLQAEDKILTCEGDVLGSLSMLAHQAIGGKTPFLADFSQINFSEDYALLWHCGVAPSNLWNGKCVRSLDSYFAGGKGVTADFVMKAGAISMARIDYSPGEYRIFLQKAMGQDMEKVLKGTYVKVRFSNDVKSVLEKIVQNGIAHHVSIAYGDFIKPFEIFAKLIGWRIIR